MRVTNVWIDCNTGYLGFQDSEGDICGICETADIEHSTEFCQIYADGEVCTEEEIWEATYKYFRDCTKTVIHRSLQNMSVHLVTADKRFREFTLDYQLHACKGPGDRLTSLLGSGPAVSNKTSALDRLENSCPVVVQSQHDVVETSTSPDENTFRVTTYADELVTSPQTYTDETRSSAYTYTKEDITSVHTNTNEDSTTAHTYADEVKLSAHTYTNEDTESVHTHTEEVKAGVHMPTNEGTANTQKPPSRDVSYPSTNQDDVTVSENMNTATGQQKIDEETQASGQWHSCWTATIILAILLTLSVLMHIVALYKRRKRMKKNHVEKDLDSKVDDTKV